MKTRQVLGAMMGAALLSGTTFAQADGPQGPVPRDEGQGLRPPCAGQGQDGAGMRRGGSGQEGGPGMRRGGPGPGMEIGRKPFPNPKRLKEAGATEAQLTALKTFANEQQLKRIDLQAAVDKAELTLEQLMGSEAADEKAALKAADVLSQARAELFQLEISSKLKMNEILGSDVQKKLREMGPPEGMERQGRGPRPEGQDMQRKDRNAPPAGDRPPQPLEQK